MQEIVDEVIRDRDNRIEQSMCRFADSRLRPGARQAEGGFLPVLGASENVEIAYTSVTNRDVSTATTPVCAEESTNTETATENPEGLKDGLKDGLKEGLKNGNQKSTFSVGKKKLKYGLKNGNKKAR